jgi:transmembrane sensor
MSAASQAAHWVVRLHAREAGEAEWLAFETWLATTTGARAAFDDAAAVWRLADQVGEDNGDGDREWWSRAGADARNGSRLVGMAALGLGGLGAVIAAGLVIALHPAPPSPIPIPRPAPTLFAAARGAPRTVVLADGTRMQLSGGSRVAVSLEPRARQVSMSRGEVTFSVAHDPARPFSVAIGDRVVRDIGTEFDVRLDGPRIRIAVREGRVEVGGRDDGTSPLAAPVALSAGQQLLHDEDTGASRISAVSAGEIFAWKQDRLVYRDQPLQAVVDDLNRRFPHAVRIEDEQTAALRFTGVLSVDAEAATIRRLTALLPIEAERINGETVLKARATSR